MRFAKWVFTLAGVYGLIVMTPMLFAERAWNAMGQPLTHPEGHYGFVGITLAFQAVFLVVGRDPVRLRPIMIPAVIEKIAFPAAAWPLFLMGRSPPTVAVFATIDLCLAVLFVLSWFRTRGA